MLMPESQVIECPSCRKPIRITLQAEMRAKTTGTAVNCPHCKNLWRLRMTPALTFSPLTVPKAPGYRRGRQRAVVPFDR